MKILVTVFTLLFISLLLLSQDIPDESFMNAFVVIADTGQDYYELRQTMFDLRDSLKSSRSNIEIDTMRRGYDPEKNLICLPLDDEDEIFAGDYYPRRYPGIFLSLEHFIFYKESTWPGDRTIALVAAITEDTETAEILIPLIAEYCEGAFILESRIYIGCMH